MRLLLIEDDAQLADLVAMTLTPPWTVEGTGRYFILWGKCTSDGTQAGSIDADFTVAFADS